MKPRISCILATGNRPDFLEKAIEYFQHQTWPNRELIIVDDGKQPYGDPNLDGVTYMHLSHKTLLGTKLNMGIEVATGSLIQKMDDDDYYHPRFLETAANCLDGTDPKRTVAPCDRFLVWIAATGKVVHSGSGWQAGSSMCFHRELFEKGRFRAVPRAVDWWFLKDHQAHLVPLGAVELHMVVRHDQGHTWKDLKGVDPTEYFQRRPAWSGDLTEVMAQPHLAFYRNLGSPKPREPVSVGGTRFE